VQSIVSDEGGGPGVMPGATVLDGRFNVVQMSIAVPKHNAAALTIVDEFVRDAKRDGLIAQATITRWLRAVHPES
jgi:hypothetical protein